jgi:hypothetical protein
MRMRAKYVDVRFASGRGVAARWHSQYCDGGKWRMTPTSVKGRSSEQVYNDLCALGENPDIDKVAEIIGNKSWTHISCDGCPDYVERAISIGEHEPKAYCPTCLREAYAVLQEIEA